MNSIKNIDNNSTSYKYENLNQLKRTADDLFISEKYKLSIEYYKKIINAWPKELVSILLQFEKQYSRYSNNTNLGLALAELYRYENNLDEAIFVYDDLLFSDPLNLDIYNELIIVLKKQNKYDEIIKYTEKAYLLGIFDEEIAHSLAIAYIECNKIPKAIAVYEKLINTIGEKENLLKTLSALYFQNKDFAKTIEISEKRLIINKNSYNDVILFMEKCRDALTDNVEVNSKLINLYINYTYYHKALDLLEIFLSEHYLEKKDFIELKLNDILKSSPDLHAALLLRAKFFNFEKRYSESADDYNQLISNPFYEKLALEGLNAIIQTMPTQVSALQYLANYYHLKGNIALELEYMTKLMNADISKSISVLKECKNMIENNPKNYQAKLTMAEAYLKNEDFHQSIEIAKEILEKGENNDDAYRIIVLSYVGIRDFTSMRKVYEDAKRNFINKKGLYELYSDIYPTELNLRKDFYRSKYKSDQTLDSHLDYIKAMIENKQFSDALIKLQEIIKNNTNYQLYYLQAISFIGLNNYFSAIVSLNKSLENIFIDSSPEYVKVLQKQAEVYEMIGSIDSAMDKYRTILEIDFSKENIKKKEEMLKNCPYLEVSGKSLILVSKDLSSDNTTIIFNRNIFKNKQKENIESSMGIISNNEAVEDILKGKISSAYDRLKIAEQMDATHKNILNNKAILLMIEKKSQEALKIFESIVKSKKDSSTCAYYHIGFILTYTYKKYKEAEAFVKKAIQLDEDFFEAYLLLGDIYFYKNNIEKANENWLIYKNKGLLSEFSSYRLFDVEYIL
jgi:tetratricopeptide (TPR) repeat protein